MNRYERLSVLLQGLALVVTLVIVFLLSRPTIPLLTQCVQLDPGVAACVTEPVK